MAVIHRALLLWALFTVFFILIVLKIDERSNLNWFVVFIPMFVFDFEAFTYFLVKSVQFWRRMRSTGERFFAFRTLSKQATPISCVFLKLLFEILLCLRLQYFARLSLYAVITPLFALLFILSAVCLRSLIRVQNSGN
ncbi:Transmembrane protein 60-like protein [Dinothrombium tinctorium]|uniref:Transmembrane protein 60-like protein n=1 Tax=Dinothrombium tinctorium TaxID=1965070 RepID=A0A3S4QPV4_9ACAR|nr:Transmembrane protein 60-like protein [Dinothrombium tinctorium]